jgi:glycosyltransferase involved in cell wall biosynthesis
MIRSLFYADAVLVQTKKLRDFFQPLYPWANLVWFPNSRPRSGEDMRATIKPNNQRHSHEKRFVYLGVVKPSKGIREILSVAKSLNDVPFTVDVYGPLEEGLTQDEFEGQTKVVYRGVVDNKEAISLLASYDALLLPSYYEGEGHPGVILEAYMAGIPVITTRWRTIPEIVEDGISGILIEPRDINSLGRAIRRLIEDPDYMNALKMGASKHGEKFTSEYWIQDVFVKLCRSVVKKQQPDLESEVAHESP